MKFLRHLKSDFSFRPRRQVFVNEKGPDSQQPDNQETKGTEKTAEVTQPVKAPETYTAEDLNKTKAETLSKIEAKIKHPGIQKEAKDDLDGKLKPLVDQLSKLGTDKNAERLAVKASVDKAVTDVLEDNAHNEFNDLTAEGIKFTYDQPVKMEQYDTALEKATSSVKSYNLYKQKPGGKIVEQSDKNGVIIFKVQDLNEKIKGEDGKDKNKYGADDYKDVTIDGNNVSESTTSLQLEDMKSTVEDFKAKFDAWKMAGGDNIVHFGNPPTMQIDLGPILKETGLKREDLTMSLVLNMKDKMGEGVANSLAAMAKVADETVNITYDKDKNGQYYEKERGITQTSLLKPDSLVSSTTEKDPDGNILSETAVSDEIVNQQKQKVTTKTEYWPPEPGKPPKIKQRETYKDKDCTSHTEYDKDGVITKAEAYMEGQDEKKGYAIDSPVLDENGKPKMTEAKDDWGRPVDEKGRAMDKEGYLIDDKNGRITPQTKGDKPKMEPELTRVMHLKDAKGNDLEIKTFAASDPKNKEQTRHEMDAYMKDLGGKLQDPEQIRAFLKLMFKYQYDNLSPSGNERDNWQTAEESLMRVDTTGRMRGDCEDQAIFMQRLLSMQEPPKTASVLGVPGHAECIRVYGGPPPEGAKYHAVSYGTFGVDIDGNQVGSAPGKKTEGYNTPEEAMAQLQEKWHVKQSGNPDMRDGSFKADALRYQNEERMTTSIEGKAGMMSLTPEDKVRDLIANAKLQKYDDNVFWSLDNPVTRYEKQGDSYQTTVFVDQNAVPVSVADNAPYVPQISPGVRPPSGPQPVPPTETQASKPEETTAKPESAKTAPVLTRAEGTPAPTLAASAPVEKTVDMVEEKAKLETARQTSGEAQQRLANAVAGEKNKIAAKDNVPVAYIDDNEALRSVDPTLRKDAAEKYAAFKKQEEQYNSPKKGPPAGDAPNKLA